MCGPGVCSLRECLPIISQEGNLKKPKGGKANKSQNTFLCHYKEITLLAAWHASLLTVKHTYGDIGGTWRMN